MANLTEPLQRAVAAYRRPTNARPQAASDRGSWTTSPSLTNRRTHRRGMRPRTW